MIYNNHINDVLTKEFKQKLRWFEEEFKLIFKYKTHNYTNKDIQLANKILDKLSETINQFRDNNSLYDLVSTFYRIEREYPEFF